MSIKGGNLYCAQILGVQKGEKGSPGELSGLIRYRNDNVIGQIRVNSSNGIYGSFTSSSGNNITELQAAASASDDTVNASESFNQSKTSFWDFADSFSGNDSPPISLRQMKLDARKLGLVGGQDFRQDDPAAGMGDSDGKLSCGEILYVGDFLVGLIPQVQKLPGPGL